MGKTVDFLACSESHYKAVQEVARAQFARRCRAYRAIAICEKEDLAQELWVKLLEREASGRLIHAFTEKMEDFKEHLVSLAEVIAQRGRRKLKEMEEIPISQFEEEQREVLENLYYSC